MVAIDFKKMRKELISLYERFLKNPESESIKEEFMVYGEEFGGITVLNDYLKSMPVPKDIFSGLCGLSMISDQLLFEDKNQFFTKEIIFDKSKKILEELKKQDK